MKCMFSDEMYFSYETPPAEAKANYEYQMRPGQARIQIRKDVLM
jgi:hypothetical protein